MPSPSVQMYRVLVLLAMLAANVGGRVHSPATPPPVIRLDGRIFGGEDADIADFRYQVSVRIFGVHICGGSIVNEKLILTAAHCIYDIYPGYYTVQYGSSELYDDAPVIAASGLLRHYKYNPDSTDYDIAQIFLVAPIEFGDLAQPIHVATEDPPTGTKAIVSGWGVTKANGYSSHHLQQVEVEIIDRDLCTKQYSKISEVTERMLCAGVEKGGKDACYGDSGGPLVVGQQLVGIVSWGVACARPDYAGVYASVANLRPWFEYNLP